MKTLRQILAFAALACALLAVPLVTPGCASTPKTQAVQVHTLLAVGHTAEEAVALSARLYRDGKISDRFAREVLTEYDKSFQPAFRIAVMAVKGDLSAIAPADLMQLLARLTTLVANLQKP